MAIALIAIRTLLLHFRDRRKILLTPAGDALSTCESQASQHATNYENQNNELKPDSHFGRLRHHILFWLCHHGNGQYRQDQIVTLPSRLPCADSTDRKAT